jgi:hypothetical protein
MKLTKKQKIGVGVLLLAATAFGVDRLFLSPSGQDGEVAQASAPAAAPRAADGAKATEGGTQRQQQQAAAALLAQRLNQVAAAEGLAAGKATDAFRPPPAWYPPPAPKPSPTSVASAATPPPPDKAAMFRSSHKLMAVMRGSAPGYGVAVLTGPSGGVTARVGQAVDGFVLKTVRDNGVVMSNGKQEVVLELSKPGLTASASTAP